MVGSVQLPLDEPVSDVQEAVPKLTECSEAELQRARKHHRRAVQALRDGGYGALSASTREHLLKRLRQNLEALNLALRAKSSSETQTNPQRSSSSQLGMSGFRLSDLLSWLP